MIPLPFTLLFWVRVFNPLCVSCLEKIFSICGKAGLVVLNSLSFCLSVKLFISPSCLNEILAGYSNLGCRLISFITLNMSCHSLLAWSISIERSAVTLMEIPLCVVFPLLLLIFVLYVWSLLIWLICVLGCLLFFILKISLFLAVLSFHCYAQSFFSCCSQVLEYRLNSCVTGT